jgi:hypothetical protein
LHPLRHYSDLARTKGRSPSEVVNPTVANDGQFMETDNLMGSVVSSKKQAASTQSLSEEQIVQNSMNNINLSEVQEHLLKVEKLIMEALFELELANVEIFIGL